jgi:putative peptidoglycan lipid II flippase
MQVSAFIDQYLASFLGEGAMGAMTNAQSIYMLPVSLFGMSVSAAELPAMSSETSGNEALRLRLNAGLRQIAFFIVPSAMAFFAFGDVIVAVLYESGRFTHADSRYVWGIVAGSAVGLLASTLGRLYQSTYYATRDTRTPLKFAVIRVILTGAFGWFCAMPLPGWLGLEQRWGVAGLTASAGVAGWVEFALLRATLNRRIGPTGLPAELVARLWGSALLGAAVGWWLKMSMTGRKPVVLAAAVLVPYGLVYLAATWGLGVEECAGVLRRVRGRLKR